MKSIIPLILFVAALCLESAEGFSNIFSGNRQKPCPTTSTNCRTKEVTTSNSPIIFGSKSCNALRSSAKDSADLTAATDDKYSNDNSDIEEDVVDYDVPEDAVINIQPKAMKRLRELRGKQKTDSLVLRMGVRNGGCSGLSYVMDFSTEDDIQEEDVVDEYPMEGLKCVVDAKSMLYLYGLKLDYSEELIGGGFKFFNPNAEESCGCGSSFGV